MKVQCEYCQNMVEAGGDKICPYCGSPLPAAPEKPADPAPSSGGGLRPALLLLPVILAASAFLLLRGVVSVPVKDGPLKTTRISISDALDAVNSGAAGGEAYQAAISYYLEGGQIDAAYQAAWDLMEGGGPYMEWCVQEFSVFGRQDLAARLAMAGDAMSGAQELYPLTADTSLDKLLPDSPLCQAMELALGRTAGEITLADLQAVTGLSIGRRDAVSGAQEIGVAFDEDGLELNTITVEFTGEARGLGSVCFQGLRRLTLNDSNVRTREDLLLPGLRELSIPLPMDAENLLRFVHLQKLERLQVGVSLEGLDQLPALRELSLFDTGLTDLSVLAVQRQLTHLELRDNDQLTSVASLSQASHLKSLTLSGASLADLSPLAALSGLERLCVTGTAICDAAFLTGMTGLRSLVLRENRELRALKLRASKKLSFLRPLRQLEELTVYSYEAAWDISELSQFQNLRRLSLSGGSDFYDSYTVSLEGLEGLRELPLEELDLRGKKIYGPLDPVLEIGTLRTLNLSGAFSEGTDYSGFTNLTQLRELDLSGYQDMVDTPPGPDEEYWSYRAGPAGAFVSRLGALTGLERLSLAGCGAEEISGLETLTSLQYLDLSGNQLTDISPLAELSGLRYVNLSGNRIGDYSPVENRTGLTLIR